MWSCSAASRGTLRSATPYSSACCTVSLSRSTAAWLWDSILHAFDSTDGKTYDHEQQVPVMVARSTTVTLNLDYMSNMTEMVSEVSKDGWRGSARWWPRMHIMVLSLSSPPSGLKHVGAGDWMDNDDEQMPTDQMAARERSSRGPGTQEHRHSVQACNLSHDSMFNLPTLPFYDRPFKPWLCSSW